MNFNPPTFLPFPVALLTLKYCFFFFFLPFSTGAFTASLIASSNNNIKPRILKIWIHVHKTIWWILSETPQDEWISLCPASFPPELVLHLYPQHRNQLESQQVKNPEAFKNLFNEIIVYWYNDKFYVSTWQSHGTQFLAKTLDVAVEVFFFFFLDVISNKAKYPHSVCGFTQAVKGLKTKTKVSRRQRNFPQDCITHHPYYHEKVI